MKVGTLPDQHPGNIICRFVIRVRISLPCRPDRADMTGLNDLGEACNDLLSTVRRFRHALIRVPEEDDAGFAGRQACDRRL